MRVLPAAVLAALWMFMGGGASAQSPASETYDVPLALMHGIPLDQSLPRLVAEGWQIVAVSLRERTFAYHLVKEGSLALCLSELGRLPPGTECMQLVDGPRPGSGDPSTPQGQRR